MYLKKIFKNKKVIVTGHTGFKGSWLTAWLKQLEANVMGISLGLPTSPSHFKVSKINQDIKDVRLDIRDKKRYYKPESSHMEFTIKKNQHCAPNDSHPSADGHIDWAIQLKEFIDVNNLRTI